MTQITTDYRTPRQRGDTDAPYESTVTPAEDMLSMMLNNVSWGAIFAGAVIALVVEVIVNLAGIGIGAATLDPGTADNPAAGALGIGAGIWFAVSTSLAALVGGIAAGRLSGRPKALTTAWHGLTAWAVSILFVIYLLGSGIGGLPGGAASKLGSFAGSVTSAAGSAVQAVALAKPFDAIERQIRSQAPANADPAAARDAAIAAVRTAVTETEAEADQARAQAAQALAQAQGIPVRKQSSRSSSTRRSSSRPSSPPGRRRPREPTPPRLPRRPARSLPRWFCFSGRLPAGSAAAWVRWNRPSQPDAGSSDTKCFVPSWQIGYDGTAPSIQ